MNEPEHDPLLQQLQTLPERDVDPWRAARIRRLALSELRISKLTWGQKLYLAYDRVMEPASLVGLIVIYLRWAFSRVAPIYGL